LEGGKTIVFQLEDRCFEQQQPAAGQQCKNQKYLEGGKTIVFQLEDRCFEQQQPAAGQQCKNQKYLEEEEEKVSWKSYNK